MEDKSLDKILSPDELKALFEMMDSPAWYILEKLNNEISKDWIEQTASLNWSEMKDEEMIRKMRHRQGQIKGVSSLLLYLRKKRKQLQKQVEKDTEH